AEAVGQSAELLCMNADAFLRASEQVIQTSEWTGELKQRSKDGRNLIIEGHWTLVRDDAGVPRSILAINNDITARKQADEAIQMQGRVLESMTEGVVVCDEAGSILFSNVACNTMFGYENGELTGQHFSVLKSSTPDEGRREVDGMLDALQSRGIWAGEIASRKKDGVSFITSMRISIVDTTGARSFVVVVEDITEKKSMEAQFLRSQRMESVGRLSSGIAHDMNNILTPILLSSFMLRRPLPGEDYDKLLGNIETSAQRGAALIKQLLTLGCEPGGQRKVLSTASLVDDMMQIMQGTFPKNINLTCRVPDDVWPVTGDATQLHQVLLNLCVNARDAMPLGGALMLTVENVRFDESYAAMSAGIQPGPYVMLRVSDTGEGIPSDILDKIFDPFFTTKETGKGTGLGLSTVMGIAKSHGGFVNVRSLVGSGTTFEVCLPAVPDGTTETATRPLSAPPRGQGETILVVDDEPNIRDVVRRTLTGHGYRVLTAGDGTEAVVLFTEHREQIKAVLTDIMMPFMDGVTMVRTMRKMAPAVKIVASTGMGSARGREDKTAALHTLGVRTLLTKPYTADEVLNTIGELLAQPALTA
ncbi:MAG: PAS domain S-box protein, partial [Prosthecobacter sp.]